MRLVENFWMAPEKVDLADTARPVNGRLNVKNLCNVIQLG